MHDPPEYQPTIIEVPALSSVSVADNTDLQAQVLANKRSAYGRDGLGHDDRLSAPVVHRPRGHP
jgi:hypothetical protein